jgi:hypothetical protein
VTDCYPPADTRAGTGHAPARNCKSREFTSAGFSCWTQCPAPGISVFAVRPGMVCSSASKSCRYIAMTASSSPATKDDVCLIFDPARNASSSSTMGSVLRNASVGDILMAKELAGELNNRFFLLARRFCPAH